MNITGVEINIEDIQNLVPLVNNNIIEFKKIVHKLSSNYKNNRVNINVLYKNDNEINDNIKILTNKFNFLNSLIIKARLDNLNNIVIIKNNNKELNKKLSYFFIANLLLTGLFFYIF